MDTPIYDSVVKDQGWSPDQAGPLFDLDHFIWDSKMKAAAALMLRTPIGNVIPIRPSTGRKR